MNLKLLLMAFFLLLSFSSLADEQELIPLDIAQEQYYCQVTTVKKRCSVPG